MVSALVISALAQPSKSKHPRFEDYPVREIFHGTPADPKIITASQRRYRTAIRQGVVKGWGVIRDVKEQTHPGPNFAGNMIVIEWGCGVPCLMAAMVDSVTGDVFSMPLTWNNTLQVP